MWIVVNERGDMMRYPRWHKGVALGLADAMNDDHPDAPVLVRHCTVTWNPPAKRKQKRKKK